MISRRTMTRREALAVLGASALAACFSDRPDGMGPGDGVVVEMTNQLTFSPSSVTIQVGDSVTWRNTSQLAHTSTCDASKANDPEASVRLPAGAEPWDSGILTPGGEFSHTFETAGTYRYFCIPHESVMVGQIIVTT
jgi:plastocyanin